MAQYDIEAIRKKIQQSMAGKHADPDEFRPPKGKNATDAIVYRFYILPPYVAGEQIGGGKVKAKKGMDNQFFVTHAEHWVDQRPYPCPRVAGTSDCPICQFGFDLLKDEAIKKDDDKRRAVLKQWMPTQYYMMNIFFPNDKRNPEDIRGRTMVYNAPKTVIDACMRTLMSDDAGDAESPEAFGLFFDETNAFVFELQILKQGSQNSYKTSKFLSTARPMIRNEDGTPNTVALAELLKSRHDLHSKIEEPDMEKIKKIYANMTQGDDSHNDGKAAGGFDEDESKPATKTVKAAPPPDDEAPPVKAAATTTTRTAAKPAAAKAAPPPDEDDAPPVKAKAAPAAAAKEPLAAEAPLADEVPGLASMLSQLDDDE